MRAIVFERPHQWRLAERPTPHPAPGEVLLRVEAAGLCGTDLHIYHGRFPAQFPLIPGHEYAGIVEQVGHDVTSIRPGELVAVEPNLPDLTCPQCKRGRTNLCQSLRAFGVQMDGGFATHCLVPADHLFVVPPGLDAEEAALLEPIGCCLHGLEQVRIAHGDRVVIIGAGWIGLIMTQLVRLRGAGAVIVSEPKQAKRAHAARLGADQVVDPLTQDLQGIVRERTDGAGADLVIEVVGSARTAAQALELVSAGGQVLIFGVAPPEATVEVEPYRIYRQEITVTGSFSLQYNHQAAARLIAARRLDVKSLVTGRFALGDFAQALQEQEDSAAIKSVLLPWR